MISEEGADIFVQDSLGDTTFNLKSHDDGVISTYSWKQVGGPFKFSTQTGAHDSGATVGALTISPTFDTSGAIMTAQESRSELKTFFETGDVPTEAGFATTVDSSVLHQRAGNYGFELFVTDNSGLARFTKDVSGAPGADLSSLGFGVDSNRVDFLMTDSLGDTTVKLTGRGTVAFRRAAGGGVAANRVEIADLNADGLLDLRVDGNVSIGTFAAPTVALNVAGDICVSGTVGACSDVRYKKDVAPMTGALKIVTRLRGVTYSWRADEFPEQKFSDERQVGFIAQELKDILPGVVSRGADGYYSVDYGRMTPVLVEANKEQRKQIESQQRQIDELKGILNRLVSDAQTDVTLSKK